MKKVIINMTSFSKILLTIKFNLLIVVLFANNLQITNATRTGTNLDEIQFTLSWDNSWMVNGAPANHDAVWIFIKFRECGQTTYEWSHALLSTNMSDHSFGSAVTYAMPITSTNRFGTGTGHNTGVMMRRNTVGVGNISNQTIRLKIVGSSNGDSLDPAKEYDIKVFGIEMVYIPQGQFYVGDAVSNYSIYIPGSPIHQPVLITSENSVTVYSPNFSVDLPASFPKGYNSFYIMKYEITQQQYCDFLNTLTSSQALYRYSNYNYHQHDINFNGAQYYTTRQDRPKPYMDYHDLLSYLDWAALRPMTEMEYEKACRGSLDFIQGEYAWGSGLSSTIIETKTVSGATSGVEVVTDGSNCHYYDTQITISGGQFTSGSGNSPQYGPVASGIYARSTTNPNRISTGATYYGVMEMSGNLWEQCIQINYQGNTVPTPYTGIWGDGQLTNDGKYNVADWPSTNYYILKGGSYYYGSPYLRVSDRYFLNRPVNGGRGQDVGGRGVR